MILQVLVEKHPLKQPPKITCIAKPDNPIDNPHPIIFFEEINGTMIRNIILKMDGCGASGASGLDAAFWKSPWQPMQEELAHPMLTQRV